MAEVKTCCNYVNYFFQYGNESMVKNAFVLSAKIKFSFLRLRDQINVISGLAKRKQFKKK